jgi:hypothetical protein
MASDDEFEDLQDIGVVLDLGVAVHQARFRCCIHPQMSSVDCFIALAKIVKTALCLRGKTNRQRDTGDERGEEHDRGRWRVLVD